MTWCRNVPTIKRLPIYSRAVRIIPGYPYVLYLEQNLFPPGKLSRTISLNSHYSDFPEPARFVGYFNLRETNVSWTYRLPHRIVSRCHEQAVRVFGDRLPPADTRKHALKNEHLTWRETNCIRKTYLSRMCRRKRSFVKMSKRMKGSLPYLHVLVKSKQKLRKTLIDNVPESVITTICECGLNLLKGVIQLTSPQKRRLARHKTHLRALANKKVSRKKKKQYLNQKGGIFCSQLCFLLFWEFWVVCWHEANGIMRSANAEKLMRITHKQQIHEIKFISKAGTHELNFLGYPKDFTNVVRFCLYRVFSKSSPLCKSRRVWSLSS